MSIRNLAEAAYRTGDFEGANDSCLRAIQEFQRIDDIASSDFAETLVLEARLDNGAGQHEAAQMMAARAVEILNQAEGDSRMKWYLSAAYGELAEAQRSLGDLVSAEKAAQSGLDVSRLTGDTRQIAARWLNLSGVSVAAGRFDEARVRIAEAEASSPEYTVLTRQSLLASALAGVGMTREAAEILEVELRRVMDPDNRVVMEFQLAGLLATIPNREAEAAGLLAKNKRAIEERFQAREITSADIATALLTAEPFDADRKTKSFLYPSSAEGGNPYLG